MMFLLAYHYICQTWLLKRGFFTIFIICCFKRGFGLPQRLQLRILKNFVSEKLGKSCEKSGEHWIKSGNREIFRGFIFLLYPRLRFYMSDRDEMFLSVSIFHHINKYTIYINILQFVFVKKKGKLIKSVFDWIIIHEKVNDERIIGL